MSINPNLSGEPVKDLSKLLAKLWMQTFNKNMNITIIRYWKATRLALAATTQEQRELITSSQWYYYSYYN